MRQIIEVFGTIIETFVSPPVTARIMIDWCDGPVPGSNGNNNANDQHGKSPNAKAKPAINSKPIDKFDKPLLFHGVSI